MLTAKFLRRQVAPVCPDSAESGFRPARRGCREAEPRRSLHRAASEGQCCLVRFGDALATLMP